MSPLTQLHKAGEIQMLQSWRRWWGGLQTSIPEKTNWYPSENCKSSALLLQPPAAAASLQCKPVALLVGHKPHILGSQISLPMAKTGIHAREAHSPSETSMTSGIRLQWSQRTWMGSLHRDAFCLRRMQTRGKTNNQEHHQWQGWTQLGV